MDARQDSRREEKKAVALAAAVFLFALLLRLRGLGAVYPVNDEFMQFYEALHPGDWRSFLILLTHNPHHVLLDPFTTRLAALSSESLASLRFPSALAGALGCWLLCRLGAREGRPKLGLAAGLLLSVSLLHLDWSRRADFYALLTLVSLWTAFDFFSLLDRPRAWPRLALSASLFLLSHPYAVLMAAFQGLFAFKTVSGPRRREALVSLAKAWGAAGLLFLPWFAFSTKALLDLSTFDFRGHHAVLGLGAFLKELPAALAQKPEAGLIPAWAAAAFASAYALGWAASLDAARRGRKDRLLAFSHSVLAFSLPAVVALDLRYRYYLAHRQLLWVLPFFLLAVADGWSRLLPAARARAAALAAAVLCALPLWREVTLWQEARSAGMDRLIAQLDRVLEDRDPLAFENDQLAAGFLWSFDRDAFRAIPDMRLQRGMMTYEIPDGFTARRGERTFPVSSGARCAQDARAWTLCGSVYETTVIPPSSPAGPGPRSAPAPRSSPRRSR